MSLMGLFLLIWPTAMSEKANKTEILNAILLGNRRVCRVVWISTPLTCSVRAVGIDGPSSSTVGLVLLLCDGT